MDNERPLEDITRMKRLMEVALPVTEIPLPDGVVADLVKLASEHEEA